MKDEKYKTLINDLYKAVKSKDDIILMQKKEIDRLNKKIDDITKLNINTFKIISDGINSMIEKRGD